MPKSTLHGIHRVIKTLAGGHTREYHFHRRGKGGVCIWKSGDAHAPNSSDYIEAYRAAHAAESPLSVEEGGAKIVRDLIRAFMASGEFTSRKPRTLKDYRRWLAHIDAEFGDAPISILAHIKMKASALRWRDQWSGRQADYALFMLKRLATWSVERGHIDSHPLDDIKGVYAVDRSGIIWLPEEVQNVLAIAPLPVQRVITTAIETGMRPQDMAALGRQHLIWQDGLTFIRIVTQKRERTITIPCTTSMLRLIEETPTDQLTILTNARGLPWNPVAMSKQVSAYARKAGIAEKRLYDLRGTAATKLLEHGLSVAEMAAWFGWSLGHAHKMIEVYARLSPKAAVTSLRKLERGIK